MKCPLAALLLVLCFGHVQAQIGNEWIDYDQPWLKIPVGKTGLYTLSRASLIGAGVPAGVDPKTFRLFHRGVEQSIHVAGEDDGAFSGSDYVLFYGQMNDGSLDSILYEEPGYQPHRYYNLFSDTSAYFLTWGGVRGKRMAIHSAIPSDEPAYTYYEAERMLVLHSSYAGGVDYGSLHKTTFDLGEGWMGPQILHGQSASYSVEGIDNGVAAAGQPQLEILLTGRGRMKHDVELLVNGRSLGNIAFDGFASHKHLQAMLWSDVDANGKVTVQVRVTGIAGPDRVSVGYIRIRYPRAVDFASLFQEEMHLPATQTAASLSIANAPATLVVVDITAPDNVTLMGNGGGSDTFVIPAGGPRKLFATGTLLTPAHLKPVRFRRIQPGGQDYLIITHRSLRQPVMGYTDPVKAYAEYRALPEGGGFDTLVVNIDQLYDQFNYGETSPRAVYQFLQYLQSGRLPDYLFLVGKGLDVNYNYHRRPGEFQTFRDLVPVAGFPGGDHHFSAGLGGLPEVPAIATGRLSATSPAEVAAYLNKIKFHESRPFDNLNRKKILHLSGGIETYEPALFNDILAGLETKAEDVYLGARVQPISKHSVDTKLINVAHEVNAGLGLITFFGHSAPNTLDFDIGRVTDPVMGYDNTGKYPFLFMNGCSVGSLFLNGSVFAENWVMTPTKGAIGCIAHSDYGSLTGLRRYSSLFYDVAFSDSVFIHKGVGQVQTEVAKRYIATHGLAPETITHAQQMILLGDPALRLFGADQPDYTIHANGISLSGFLDHPLTALADSFRIAVPVLNYGIAKRKSYKLEIVRSFEEQTVRYDTIVPAVFYSDTLHITIPNKAGEGYGINRFEIRIDADDVVPELNEENNVAAFEYFIPLNSTRNLYPYDFGIVGNQEISLTFQYTDLLAEPRDFILEVDTSHTFDSPFRQEYRLHVAGVGRQRIALSDIDSTVYYWRTRIADPDNNESKEWALSSFSYIAGSGGGWAQLRFPQFERNTLADLVGDPQLKRHSFRETASEIDIVTFSAVAGKPLDSIRFRIDGAEYNLLYEGGACRTNTINLVAFNRHSTRPYPGLYFTWHELLNQYGGRRLLCGREPYVINSFRPAELATGNNDDLLQYVTNVAHGDSVVVFSMGDAGYSQWPDAAFDALASIGVARAQLTGIADGDPIIIFGKKGAASGAAKVIRDGGGEGRLVVHETLSGRASAGSMRSTRIGPAQRWMRFVPFVKEVEAHDTYEFSVLGISREGEPDTLVISATGEVDLAHIDPDVYPHLQLVYETTDEEALTAVQLRGWMVAYEPVPDGLLFPIDRQVRRVYEGEPVTSRFAFVNLSQSLFADSMDIRYALISPGGAPAAQTARISAPAPGDTVAFSVTLSTQGRRGFNDVEVMANPRIQYETNYDNNIVVLRDYIYVLRDSIGPVIDVTIDGRRLLNDDFVSKSPLIEILVLDENQHLLRADTSGIRLFLSGPCSEEPCDYQAINFSRPDISVRSATAATPFAIAFHPEDLSPGRYVLRVEAHDVAGNTAGEVPYTLAFRVAERHAIHIDHPRPNPFTEDAFFEVVVESDGFEPVDYTLVVSTIDGRLVTKQAGDSNALHPGRNTIRWPGLGQGGEPLPNGIYVYRLTVSTSKQRYDSSGKLVLIR